MDLESIQSQTKESLWEQGELYGRFSLLPVQKQFLESELNDLNYYNQSRLLVLAKSFDPLCLESILNALLSHHDILRAKFENTERGWEGYYQPFNLQLVNTVLHRVDLDEIMEAEQLECLEYCCSQAQGSLDILTGELIKVIYFEGWEEGRLFIVVHNLAFDTISWGKFLSDFQDSYIQFLQGGTISLGEKLSSFRQYSDRIHHLVNSSELQKQKEYWFNSLSNPWVGVIPFDYPQFESNRIRDIKSISIDWSPNITKALLSTSNKIYRTEDKELLITALLRCLDHMTDYSALRVEINNYDRENRIDGAQISSTIGWFNYSYPLTLFGNPEFEWSELIKSVKEQCRAVPEKGIGYGVLRYLQEDPEIIAVARQPKFWIKFNYLGEMDQVLKKNEDVLFSGFANENKGVEKNPLAFRENHLVFNGSIVDGQLQFSIEYNPLQYKEKTIEKLSSEFRYALENLLSHCQEEDAGGYTPSDFPLANLSQFDVEDLEIKYPAIQDVYPATGIQLGFLYQSYLKPGAFVNQFIFSLKGQLDLPIWKKSWNLLLKEYSILRTAFTGEVNNLQQVVLLKTELPWTSLDWSEKNFLKQENDFDEYLNTIRTADFLIDKAPLMNLHVIQFSESSYRLVCNVHNAILDEGSIPLVWKRVITIYNLLIRDEIVPVQNERFPYKSFISWFIKLDAAKAQSFWKGYLGNLDSGTYLFSDTIEHNSGIGKYQEYLLEIPAALSARIQKIMHELGIMGEIVIQAAWAYLLFRYTKEDTVCFGVTVSQEPTEFNGKNEMVGLVKNILPTVVEFDKTDILIDSFLLSIHALCNEQKKFSYLSPIEIQKQSAVADSALFDTLLHFEEISGHGLEEEFSLGCLLEKYKFIPGWNYKLLVIANFEDKVRLKLGFRTSDFSYTVIEKIGVQLIHVLEGLTGGLNRPLNSLNVINIQEVFSGKPKSLKKSEEEGNELLKDGEIGAAFHDLDSSLRLDHFVKIRGFRVDLRRIESQLLAINPIKKTVVVPQEDSCGNTKLTACLVLNKNLIESGEKFIQQIKDSLSGKLTKYMIPESYILLDEVPLVTDLKIDPELNISLAKEEYVSPRNKMEQVVTDIWKEVLGLSKVGIEDNFFELGGDSFKVTRVLSMIKDQGFTISILELFQSSTISEIADRIGKNDSLIRLNQSEEIKGLGFLLPFHLLFFKSYVKNKVWNISNVYQIKEGLDAGIMQTVLTYIYEYHDALRVNFKGEVNAKGNLKNIKMINLGVEDLKPDFMVKDWSSLDRSSFISRVKEDTERIESKNTYNSKNLAAFRIYKGKDGDYFYIMASHLICDGVSFEILHNDIFEWYGMLSSGMEIQYRRKTDSYISATRKNFDYANSDEILKEIPFWMDVFAKFQNNMLLPKDYTISLIEKKLKNCVIVKELLLSDSNLSALEKICSQNRVAIIDLVLIAWGQAIEDWSGVDRFGVMFISSARLYTHSNIDLSRTFGCFATGTHMVIDNSYEDSDIIGKAVRHKSIRDSIPHGGAASSLLSELSYYKNDIDQATPDLQKWNSILMQDIPHIVFNYFDNRRSIKNQDLTNFLLPSSLNLFKRSTHEDETEIHDLFRIKIFHTKDDLLIEWTYNGLEFKGATIDRLIASTKRSLLQVIQDHSEMD